MTNNDRVYWLLVTLMTTIEPWCATNINQKHAIEKQRTRAVPTNQKTLKQTQPWCMNDDAENHDGRWWHNQTLTNT